MFNISKLTDYATLLMSQLAIMPAASYSASALADATGLALPTVSKLLKCLAQHQLLVSTRGTKGGYSLACPAEQISIAAIIEAIDGPISVTVCSQDDTTCHLQTNCTIHSNWRLINFAIRAALERISLADMAQKSLAASEVQQTIEQCIKVSEIQGLA